MNICKRAIIIALRHPLYLAIYIGFLSAMGVLLMGEVGTAQAPRPRPRLLRPPSCWSTATARPFHARFAPPLKQRMSL